MSDKKECAPFPCTSLFSCDIHAGGKQHLNSPSEPTDAGFNSIEAVEGLIDRFDTLCQLMFDPENQPPQMSVGDAWKEYLSLREGGKP